MKKDDIKIKSLRENWRILILKEHQIKNNIKETILAVLVFMLMYSDRRGRVSKIIKDNLRQKSIILKNKLESYESIPVKYTQ